eukprot:1243067-Pyramimonas_sp.AAC.1
MLRAHTSGVEAPTTPEHAESGTGGLEKLVTGGKKKNPRMSMREKMEQMAVGLQLAGEELASIGIEPVSEVRTRPRVPNR